MAVSTVVRTRTVSGASTQGPQDEELKTLVQQLAELNTNALSTLQSSLDQTKCLLQLRHTLIDNATKHDAQDSFRRAGGFHVLLDFCHSIGRITGSLDASDDIEQVLVVLDQSMAILTAALRQHAGNQKYFRVKVDGGGWDNLQESLIMVSKSLLRSGRESKSAERFFGILFASATADESLSSIYVLAGHSRAVAAKDVQEATVGELERCREALQRLLADVAELANPDVFPLILKLWCSFVSCNQSAASSSLALTIPLSLIEAVSRSKRNISDASTARLLSATLPILFSAAKRGLSSHLFEELALLLSQAGFPDLNDAQSLWCQAAKSADAASFLLKILHSAREPPSIQFDFAKQGYSSLEIANLGKSFPPVETAGYTLSLWARFDHFDSSTHTTLFGAFDTTQTCFVLAYIEKDTHQFILQTAIRGAKPSVRFKSISFEAQKWYHICIVHRRPRTMSSSRASMFVDGDLIEQIKATYPSFPPQGKGRGSSGVQAFYGTPQDLSSHEAGNYSPSKWSLASSMLVQDVLSDDLISVMFHLGPNYHGNLQDCLGSFQTYTASADLNLRNENLHPGKEDQSDLMVAIRQRASQLVKESSIILNVSPTAVLDSEDRNNVDEGQLIKSLSKNAAHNLQQYTNSGGNPIVINGAVPAINDALCQVNGIAVLTGEPAVTVPQSLDDTAWRIGGCAALGLNLIHAAKSTEDVACRVEILLETIKRNWRNSELMERDHGYAILATLLKQKLGLDHARTLAAIPTASMDRNDLARYLLQRVLDFVGYDAENESSIINNPLAYRVLLVDCNVWRCSSRPVQDLYFQQFATFVRDSKHSRFNMRRLIRMRVLKRLLEALKSESVPLPVMQMYGDTFRVLLPFVSSAETLRSLALFITYAVHARGAALGSRKSVRKENPPRSSSVSDDRSSEGSTRVLSRYEIGVEMLRIYADLLCSKSDGALIKKFAKTVTNKWLLYLMAENSPEVVVLSTRILARLLISHGGVYLRKFKEKSGGFIIMRYRLKRWWHIPGIWPLVFAILFDLDIKDLDLDISFDLFGLLELFNSSKDLEVVYPEVFDVITGMLQTGLRTIANSRPPTKSNTLAPESNADQSLSQQRLSMSTMAPPDPLLTSVSVSHVNTFKTVVTFISDLHGRSEKYREYAANSTYVQDLLHVLFPVVVGSDTVDASTELNARDSALTFDGQDVVVQPLSQTPPVIRTTDVRIQSASTRPASLLRGSSFVFVTSEEAQHAPAQLKANGVAGAATGLDPPRGESSDVMQSFLEIVVSVFTDQILIRKDFSGLGLFLRTPPGFNEHQSYFESWVLRNTLSHLSNTIMLDQNLLREPRVITNLARLFSHLGEAIFEGWFVGGGDATLDLAGSVLEYLQRPDIASIKSVRLCMQAISTIRTVIFRIVLLSLSQVHDDKSLEFLEKLSYWQTVLLAADEQGSSYLELICYLLYASLISQRKPVRLVAANLWRIILVQKPLEAAVILKQATNSEQRQLVASFEKLVEVDNETFIYWVDEHRRALDSLFFDTLSKSWNQFVVEENRKTEENSRYRVSRRREKLKWWARDDLEREETIRRHEVTFEHWTSNIHSSESLKHQRLVQDQQDDALFTQGQFSRMERDVKRPTGFLAAKMIRRWRLDQTEGRNRMRLRLSEDTWSQLAQHQPRKKGSELPSLKIDTKNARLSSAEAIGVRPSGATSRAESPIRHENQTESFPLLEQNDESLEVEVDESFEMIEDPNAGLDDFEDKNRKVMRSLHHGDQVKHVANISRIVGLEAVEGLLILGKDYLYLIDGYFQRADGEIVDVWQAPPDERDPYVRLISGRNTDTRKPLPRGEEHETRSWKWTDIISVSKRRFLFRSVGLEVFFGDGRSYLLTTLSPQSCNDLHSRISGKAPQNSPSNPISAEFGWRLDTLKSVEEEPATLGSRFASVFSQGPTLAATKKWQKGEMSNFHYLMLINTMAGRTYNDLTQYPVFPWIIADYTSEELDLSNPKTFRDLSKPMGCQTREREAEFKERYKSFAEMGDHNAPPFHYGTHYSSAMIVTSYLIRLQPFVQSYLLLQGGSFDHPDRMFFSVEGAWRSASRQNMTDVRELTPEFFYLPEFLVNVNGYDFGTRQATGTAMGNVELPPWAKGDPKIFIAKQREALESPYVSRNLHTWIDLVFGCKQKGEAALEAVNVFHHLSYHGAKDLDTIMDPVERLATIGIIHNFGQTPYQVFQKPHSVREGPRHQFKRLDTAAESLTRLPSTLLDSGERVASLMFSWKQERLLCSGAFRLNIPPAYDKYLEWGFVDDSVRFYASDSRKLIGLAEQIHIGQLSCATFFDSQTLITAGIDCTISMWNVVSSSKAVEILPRSTLFGHRRPAEVMAISRSLNVLLSASREGEVFLWDLNRAEFLRKIELPEGILSDKSAAFTKKPIGVECAHVNDVTGDLVLCHGANISLFTLNGDFVLTQNTGETVISCTAYEGADTEWLERDILFTGHRHGVVRVWSKVIRAGRFELECIRQLNHADTSRENGGNVDAGISCILAMPQVVYTGDEDGRVYEWDCVQRH